MRSLRTRLLAALLAVSAAGLLLLGAVTYAEQRSFLLQRVDQQVRSAPAAVAKTLIHQGVSAPDRPPDGGGGGPAPSLPAGSYGELRTASGKVLASSLLGYSDGSAVRLALPTALTPGRLTTVDVKGAGRYRVLASYDHPGADVVVAAIPLREVDQTLNRLLVVEALVIAGVLALLGTTSWLVVRLGLRPLERMSATAGAIAAGDLSRRVGDTDPRSETGRLGIALNAMLDRLERAFAERSAGERRLRQFLADASHELRTPLASIRGYAELFRIGAVRDPDQTARAMGRIEDEATRMGGLVEDLLTLARLDRVTETPHGPVALAELVRDAADDARATAPDREITTHIGTPGLVTGDAHQLHQVLANLLRNAVAHTPAGSPIEVGLTEDDGDVRIDVRDHGHGLPAGDTVALFERFWRAEAGRERGRAGAGLGLAIVAAIVAAHGGAVEARDAEGGGALFSVRLPAAAAVVVDPAPSAPSAPAPALLSAGP